MNEYLERVPVGVVIVFRPGIENVEPEEEDVERQEAEGKQHSKRLMCFNWKFEPKKQLKNI